MGWNGVLWDGMVCCGKEWCIGSRSLYDSDFVWVLFRTDIYFCVCYGLLQLKVSLYDIVILIGRFLRLTSTYVGVTDCSS